MKWKTLFVIITIFQLIALAIIAFNAASLSRRLDNLDAYFFDPRSSDFYASNLVKEYGTN